MLQALNNKAVLPLVATLLAFSSRAQNTLALNARSRRGVDDALWKIMIVAGIVLIAVTVLIPLVTRVQAMGTSAVNQIPNWP